MRVVLCLVVDGDADTDGALNNLAAFCSSPSLHLASDSDAMIHSDRCYFRHQKTIECWRFYSSVKEQKKFIVLEIKFRPIVIRADDRFEFEATPMRTTPVFILIHKIHFHEQSWSRSTCGVLDHSKSCSLMAVLCCPIRCVPRAIVF